MPILSFRFWFGALLLGGVVLAAVGCKSSRGNVSGYPCDVSNGRYLDFETHACVAVVDQHTRELLAGKDYETLYRLYNYWRLVKRANEGDAPILNQVSFEEYQSADALSEIIATDAIDRVDSIAYYVPNLPVIGQWYAVEALPPASTKETALADGEARLRTSFTPAEDERNAAMAHTIDVHKYKIGGVRVIARPSAMAAWWEAHPDLVRIIQPADGPFGKMQMLFEPGQEISP